MRIQTKKHSYKIILRSAVLTGFMLALSGFANAAVIDDVVAQLSNQGASPGQAEKGAAMWTKSFSANSKPLERSCSTCHTRDLRNTGKHVKTGKPIKPMAPSVNSERLSDAKKIAKWLKRNCKWTLGRECTAQEKADVISYLRSL